VFIFVDNGNGSYAQTPSS